MGYDDLFFSFVRVLILKLYHTMCMRLGLPVGDLHPASKEKGVRRDVGTPANVSTYI